MGRDHEAALEQRLTPERCEVRARDETRATIIGYAATFNSRSENLGGFVEQVAPGAFTKTIKERDIRALVNHDPNWLLGRVSAGNLRLAVDGRGLHYEVDVNLADPDGRRAVEKIDAGLIDSSSFSFRTIRDEWTQTEQGYPQRTLEEVAVRDLGPATFPAYPDASVALRTAPEEILALIEERAAIASHSTATTDDAWDANAAMTAITTGAAGYRAICAWVDPDGDRDARSSYKFPHHARPGAAANLRACSTGIAILNGARGGTMIPDADRRGVWAHLARHLRDGDREPPELRDLSESEAPEISTPLLTIARHRHALMGRRHISAGRNPR